MTPNEKGACSGPGASRMNFAICASKRLQGQAPVAVHAIGDASRG